MYKYMHKTDSDSPFECFVGSLNGMTYAYDSELPAPTAAPTITSTPTSLPTYSPTQVPYSSPTYSPTPFPTYSPTQVPTPFPTHSPTTTPSPTTITNPVTNNAFLSMSSTSLLVVFMVFCSLVIGGVSFLFIRYQKSKQPVREADLEARVSATIPVIAVLVDEPTRMASSVEVPPESKTNQSSSSSSSSPPPPPPPIPSTQPECVVCLDNPAVMACIPCGHQCLCSEHAGAYASDGERTCPCCRQKLTPPYVMKIFA
jgi:hypothetical protein